MITKCEMRSEAYMSEDRRYRYWLLRRWDEALPSFSVIGSNPSTADETADDPTIRKVVGFGKRLGYGGVLMLNVGAYRATNPKEWKAEIDPFGPENTLMHLWGYLDRFQITDIIAAWGKPCLASVRGTHRAESIKRAFPEMKCWGKNSDGSPRHPLMIPYSTPLEPFSRKAEA